MKKDEIIELLKEQLRVANATVSSLTTQVNELIERIKSLEELLVQKGIAIDKANRQNKAPLEQQPTRFGVESRMDWSHSLTPRKSAN